MSFWSQCRPPNNIGQTSSNAHAYIIYENIELQIRRRVVRFQSLHYLFIAKPRSWNETDWKLFRLSLTSKSLSKAYQFHDGEIVSVSIAESRLNICSYFGRGIKTTSVPLRGQKRQNVREHSPCIANGSRADLESKRGIEECPWKRTGARKQISLSHACGHFFSSALSTYASSPQIVHGCLSVFVDPADFMVH